jgi:hypothetical protein
MIPEGFGTDLEVTNEIKTSRTFKVTSDKMQGFIDGREALVQSIYLVLNTERYEYPILSFDYGIELESLIGKDPAYVQVEFKRRIRECLLKDDRITEVDNFQFAGSGDELRCTFDVSSIYGDVTISKDVYV